MKRMIAMMLLLLVLPLECLAKNYKDPDVLFNGKSFKKNNVVLQAGKDLHITIKKCEWVNHARFFCSGEKKAAYTCLRINLGKFSQDIEVCIPGYYLTNSKKHIHEVHVRLFAKNNKSLNPDNIIWFYIKVSGEAKPFQEEYQIKKVDKNEEVNLEISNASEIEYIAVRRQLGFEKVYTPQNDTSLFYANEEYLKDRTLQKEFRNEHFFVQDGKIIVPLSVKNKTKIQISVRKNGEWSEWSKEIAVSP